MKTLVKSSAIALVGLVAISHSAKSKEVSLSSLFDLSSSVAAKVEQPIQDAPGIVSVYTKKDIEKLGYYTLADLADITAGYSSTRIYAEKGFETRGQAQDAFENNNHLVLIDGIPVNHARANKAPAAEELPVAFAKRVEFLKGPASALYGISAFYGVVNVVSDSPSEDGANGDVKLSYGSEDQKQRVMTSLTAKNENGVTQVSAGYYNKLASKKVIPAPEAKYVGQGAVDWYNGYKPSANHKYWDDNTSEFLYASHKFTDGYLDGLGLGFIYMSRTTGLGEFWMGPFSSEINSIKWTTAIPYIKYDKKFSDEFNWNSYALANYSIENGDIEGWFGNGVPFDQTSINKTEKVLSDSTKVIINSATAVPYSAYNVPVLKHEFSSEIRYNFTETMNLIAGIDVDTRKQQKEDKGSYGIYVNSYNPDGFDAFTYDAVQRKGSQRLTTYSAYLQAGENLPVLNGMLLTLGLRSDNTKYGDGDFASKISPRAAIVQKLNDNINLKFLAGGALRAPGIKEYVLNDEAKIALATKSGAPVIKDLTAESIMSYEGGLTFVNDNIFSSVSYFYNTTTDKLSKDGFSGTNYWKNQKGDVNAQGAEVDLQIAANKNFKVFGNYAIAMSDNYDPSKNASAALRAGVAQAEIDKIKASPDAKAAYEAKAAYIKAKETQAATYSDPSKNIVGYYNADKDTSAALKTLNDNIKPFDAQIAPYQSVIDANSAAKLRLAEVPLQKINAGITYNFDINDNFGLTSTFMSKYISGFRNSQNDDWDGIMTFDLNLIAKLGKKFDIGLQVLNIADEENALPWVATQQTVSSPLPGREFIGTITARF